MKDPSSRRASFGARLCVPALALTALLAGACEGDRGPAGPPGPPGGAGPTETELARGEAPPGLNVAIVTLTGGTGAGGAFVVGDRVTVTFTLEKDDGSSWTLPEMGTARLMVSGPSFNYQRVLPEVSDVVAASVPNADGSYSYTFADPIPATYAAPINDSPSFGPEDGDLSGQPLLDGTYTVGSYFAWNFTVEGSSARDVGNAEADFLLGSSTTVTPREVVTQANCNQCHQTLQAHGGQRQDVKLCLLCHTAGSEDGNDPSVLGGTPGASIEFKVMIHKIHSGARLPSVLGVSTNANGSRNYAAVPQPYRLIGRNNSIADFSDVRFPVWPNAQSPLPRDTGYTALSSTDKATEDLIRGGPANCLVCHGDPDGAGPLPAPAQGDLYKAQPSRRACGSCHDDVVWGQPYTANLQTMGAQANDANCLLCHAPSGTPIATQDAHTHPQDDPTFNPGLVFDITSLVEAGTNNGSGKIDPGEKIAITFTLRNGTGTPVVPSTLSSISTVLSGPTSNYNVILNTSIPAAALTGSEPFTINLPQPQLYEFVGDSTGAVIETFTTSRTPHWNVAGALTSVQVRTGTAGGASTLAAAAPAVQNFLDVANATGFARDDFVVIEDGVPGKEEYLKIQTVEGNRLWFSSPYTSAYAPGVRFDHDVGAAVAEVTLVTKAAGTDYTVTAATGQIAEVLEFGPGAVLVSYTSDFVMPAVFPQALNGSPDLDDSSGKWTAKPIIDGTYSLGVWGQQNLTLAANGESNSYRNTSLTTREDFLVGTATTIEPYALISSEQNCTACHQDIVFHGGGRRGYDSCLMCHGTAGSEDRPQYVAPGAPPTTGTTVNFRTMLHKIHAGADLANASTYDLVGFGSGAYPNNFATANYAHVVFPALPDGVSNCTKCHGESNTAWQEPAGRSHPTQQLLPVKTWRAACATCHDDKAAIAHIESQTAPSGAEGCAVCHGPGNTWDVARMHKTY